MQNFTLNDGFKMPCIGLGTFPMRKDVLKYAVNHFLTHEKNEGNKLLLDSARDYGNENDLGDCLHSLFTSHIVNREQLFVTTKIGNRQQVDAKMGKVNLVESVKQSLYYLQLDYVDLLLMHWPYPNHYIDTWKAMEEVKKLGLSKSIGVCNFRVRHMEKLLANASIIPAVNQIEVHPLRTATEDVNFCRQKGIQIQAYCPLGLMDKRITESQTLNDIANRHSKSIAQIILRWDFQHGIASVPKSSSPKRIDSNFDIFNFTLTDEEIHAIDSLDQDYKFYTESFYCPGY